MLVGINISTSGQSIKMDNSKKLVNFDKKFKMQPVAILTIKSQIDTAWIFQVNYLKRNPKWLPSGNDTESFYLHLNPEIINLTVTSKTITQRCADSHNANTADFIAYIQKWMDQDKREAAQLGKKPNEYTALFDIEGETVTMIHEQCLP